MQPSFPVRPAVVPARPSGPASALRILSDANSDGVQRQAAASLVIQELDSWGAAVIRKRYALKELPHQAVVADALQHAAVVAATTRTPFQGNDDPAARAWLRRVLLNFVADEFRRASAMHKRTVREEEADEVSVPDSDVDDSAFAADLAEQAVEDLTRAVEFLRQLRDSMRKGRRARDAESLLRASLVYVAHLSGMPTDEQLRLLGLTHAENSIEAKRAHDQVYQMRRRGRTAILHALSRRQATDGDSAS